MKTFTLKEFESKINETFERWKNTDYKNNLEDINKCFGWKYEDAIIEAYNNGNCDFDEEYRVGIFTQEHMDTVLMSMGSYFDTAAVHVREGGEDNSDCAWC